MFAMNRLNPRGLQFHLVEIPENRTRITCGDKSIIINHDIRALSQAWYNWQMRGEKVQVAFMFLNDGEREFLLTGITPEEWNAIFAEEEN